MNLELAKKIVDVGLRSGIEGLLIVTPIGKGDEAAVIFTKPHNYMGDVLNAVCVYMLHCCVEATKDILTRNFVNQGNIFDTNPIDFILSIRDCNIIQEGDRIVLC